MGLGFLSLCFFELSVNGGRKEGGRKIEVCGTLVESRKKKVAMAQGQYSYMRLQDAVLHMNERVNFYGVVAEYEQPKSTRGKGFSFLLFSFGLRNGVVLNERFERDRETQRGRKRETEIEFLLLLMEILCFR